MQQPSPQPAREQPVSTEHAGASERRKRRSKASMAPVAVLVIATVVTALIMAFGYPTLWKPAANTQAPTASTLPATVDVLPENVVVLAEYRTVSQSTDENRSANLQRAAQALDGVVLAPGETVSVNAVLGDTSASPDYLDAPAFSGSEIVAERGGGVCQVASALYVAALKANIQVVERHAHTIACDYIPLGLDATLAYGSKDLKIQNDTSEPMYITATAEGQTVRVAILGNATSSGVSFDVFSRITGQRIVPNAEVSEELGLSDLPEDGSTTLYDVESYKVKYVTGEAQETELVANDVYIVPTGQGNN